jgi:A/G-specific adenine glycosylase
MSKPENNKTNTVRPKLLKSLLNWYDKEKRQLPWRDSGNPYHIWVSEVMLQQTQVTTVIPYYRRFIAAFPTMESLAQSSLDDVLKLWENLGYYARARNLHQAAKKVMSEYNGQLPEHEGDLRALPGIGPYLAGALASMAFNRPVPAVDANVKRVMARLFNIDRPVEQTQTQKQIQEIAENLVPKKRPGDFNQALMDLGARICVPRNPKCKQCPLSKLCQAHIYGLENNLPVKAKAKTRPRRHAVAAVIRDKQGRYLLVRRKDKGLLGGLWKWPGGLLEPDESFNTGLKRTVEDELGIGIRPGKRLTQVDHEFSHFRMTLTVHAANIKKGDIQALGCSEWRWVSPNQFDDLALAKADRTAARIILDKSLF